MRHSHFLALSSMQFSNLSAKVTYLQQMREGGGRSETDPSLDRRLPATRNPHPPHRTMILESPAAPMKLKETRLSARLPSATTWGPIRLLMRGDP